MDMKTTKLHYWLYNAGLLETLTFRHEQKVYWFMSWNTNGFDYVIEDGIPDFVKIVDLL